MRFLFLGSLFLICRQSSCIDENGNDKFELMDWSNLKELQTGMTNARVGDVQEDDDLDLNYETVAQLASLPLHCHGVEYPNKLNQVLQNETELLSPSELHPIFYGCFDWHSSVHGHWLLARAAALFPNTDLAQNVSTVFNKQFTTEKVEQELKYFQRKTASHFERTYGWAWLLKLQEELEKSALETGSTWNMILRPLTDHVVSTWKTFLPKLVYPVRVGEHTNSAFGLALALDYARTTGVQDETFETLITSNSTDFYQTDQLCPINYEPSGFDFLSPCLQEADLMVKVIHDQEDFTGWLQTFFPQLFDPEFVLQPGEVVDRTDGKLVHLDGVNFSRAWSLYGLAKRLGGDHRERLVEMGDTHVRTSLENVVGSDYAGSHWLATFLLYALEKRAELEL